jgi:hypothetical protein
MISKIAAKLALLTVEGAQFAPGVTKASALIAIK